MPKKQAPFKDLDDIMDTFSNNNEYAGDTCNSHPEYKYLNNQPIIYLKGC